MGAVAEDQAAQQAGQADADEGPQAGEDALAQRRTRKDRRKEAEAGPKAFRRFESPKCSIYLICRVFFTRTGVHGWMGILQLRYARTF
ncbi:hypothetical protein [Chelatococcus reniformis]|uniref:hypothetical protein n=1 Tax=Chelatococcus reniformis TaxID=1494448 RepID=UPI001FCEFA04|nr:hypothetical protein [Chelatococcus reniformis]